ncbi:hypothetical protein GEV33_002483 [Tenebrio molitor]|uniref:Uncharacterized protein n=1 Tax=Tenebrio molitor TaxID=7067 RepID=A0A8J6HVH6_TENMO|nr:hypothetical protein GEV33_002483 [Tenebrio molitor]
MIIFHLQSVDCTGFNWECTKESKEIVFKTCNKANDSMLPVDGDAVLDSLDLLDRGDIKPTRPERDNSEGSLAPRNDQRGFRQVPVVDRHSDRIIAHLTCQRKLAVLGAQLMSLPKAYKGRSDRECQGDSESVILAGVTWWSPREPLETIRLGTTALISKRISDRSPDRTLSGSSPRRVHASQGRLLAHRKVPNLPTDQVRSSGKEEEFDVLPLTGGRCNCIAPEERVDIPPPFFLNLNIQFKQTVKYRQRGGKLESRDAVRTQEIPKNSLHLVQVNNLSRRYSWFPLEARDLFVIPLNSPDSLPVTGLPSFGRILRNAKKTRMDGIAVRFVTDNPETDKHEQKNFSLQTEHLIPTAPKDHPYTHAKGVRRSVYSISAYRKSGHVANLQHLPRRHRCTPSDGDGRSYLSKLTKNNCCKKNRTREETDGGSLGMTNALLDFLSWSQWEIQLRGAFEEESERSIENIASGLRLANDLAQTERTVSPAETGTLKATCTAEGYETTRNEEGEWGGCRRGASLVPLTLIAFASKVMSMHLPDKRLSCLHVQILHTYTSGSPGTSSQCVNIFN